MKHLSGYSSSAATGDGSTLRALRRLAASHAAVMTIGILLILARISLETKQVTRRRLPEKSRSTNAQVFRKARLATRRLADRESIPTLAFKISLSRIVLRRTTGDVV